MEGTEIGCGGGAPSGEMNDPNILPVVKDGSFGAETSGSDEDNEWLNRHDHPLMNNVVLDIIFKQLRGNELKECRLACKAWNVATIPFTREEFKVTIYGNLNPEEKLHTIENFVELFRLNNMGIPFAKFKLGSFCTTDGVGQEFLQLCGNTIKSVEFLEDNFRVEDVSELLKSTQKLETLEIPKRIHSSSGNVVKLFQESKPRLTSLKKFTVFLDKPKERNKCCPTFLEEIITAAENISSLSTYDSSSFYEEENHICSSFEVLSLIEKLGREPFIQDITITHYKKDDSGYVELLHKMAAKLNGLKLKRFQYDAHNSNLNVQPISKVISLFKDTLQYLNIETKHFISLVEFPQMTCLDELEVTFSNDFNSKYVNLSKIFPVLEEIYLSDFGHCEYDEFFPESEPCPTINNVYMYGMSLKINGFNQMLTVFPNLTDFQFSIKADGEEILRIIWTQMTQLESLFLYGTIQGKTSLDCLLTGISDEVLSEIRDIASYLEKMTSEVERREMILELRNEQSQLPSITNLTKLKSLTLELIGNGQEKDEWKYLTDLTGYLGFYSMKNLKRLRVKKCELTNACSEILSNDLGLESCTFINS